MEWKCSVVAVETSVTSSVTSSSESSESDWSGKLKSGKKRTWELQFYLKFVQISKQYVEEKPTYISITLNIQMQLISNVNDLVCMNYKIYINS